MVQLQPAIESLRLQRRAFWMRQLHQWHWISSAMCLIGLPLFALTGITLSHARQIEATPAVSHRALSVPAALRTEVAGEDERHAVLPPSVDAWRHQNLRAQVAGREAEWSADEIYLSLPRRGGDGWLSIDRVSGEVEYELTRRGAIAYLNDLHKGRNAGPAWSWFLDVFALACLVFAISGLFLLKFHAARRPSTWLRGIYWVSASTEDNHSGSKLASKRRLSYTATLEVLPA